MTKILKRMSSILLGFFVKKMQIKTERVFWMVLDSATKHKGLMSLSFLLNAVAAVFEGVSVALLAVSVSIITSADVGNFILSDQILKYLFDSEFVINNRDKAFFLVIFLAILAQLAKAVFSYLGVVSTIHLRISVLYDMQKRMIRHIMNFSLSQINAYPGGELASYVGMAGSVSNILLILNGFISKLLQLVSYVVLMFLMSIPLTIIAIVVSAIMVLSLSKIFIRIRWYGRRITRSGIKVSKHVMEFLHAPKFLRIYGQEKYAGDVIINHIEKGLDARKKGGILRAVINPVMESISIILVGLSLVVGYYLLNDVESGSRLATLLAFALIFKKLVGLLSDLNGDRASVTSMMPSIELVAEVLRVDNKDYTRQEGDLISDFSSKIELKNIGFSYSGSEKSVLSNINLTIPRSSVVAIVGESGAGKTTLIDILLGLYQPSEGSVEIDGVSSSQILPESWVKQFCVVSQETSIFNLSIKDNLMIVNPASTEMDMVKATKLAHAYDFIMDQPDKFDTLIGDRGHRLSGGQVQRLSFARALLSDANILVLDEATSALDSMSEQRIIKSLKELDDQYTVVQIAHRLSTIRHADMIVVMDKGKVVEFGAHDDLLKANGAYYQMWNLQINGMR